MHRLEFVWSRPLSKYAGAFGPVTGHGCSENKGRRWAWIRGDGRRQHTLLYLTLGGPSLSRTQWLMPGQAGPEPPSAVTSLK
ncbi:hypothetical protein PILCRDRAFT_323861 [Piloderma croceum F 1598]|uniref:Uncharacterized protein n=1 Tax=Piloderma croceum (strain F 1598) TaxID=765440 RepID=A0A0C3G3C9_PILCF|nr:hypothetical protein PILCRDRAFT_323861 [Piloderma croceum F 1598]